MSSEHFERLELECVASLFFGLVFRERENQSRGGKLRLAELFMVIDVGFMVFDLLLQPKVQIP